jgi:hypothetical protein
MGATQAKVDTNPTLEEDAGAGANTRTDDLVIYPSPPDSPPIVVYAIDDDPFVVDWAPPRS